MDGIEWNLLKIGAIVAGRLEAIQSELGGDILRGQLSSTLARPSTLEQIVREKLDVGANLLRIDAVGGLPHFGRHAGDAGNGRGLGRGERKAAEYGEG